MPTLPDTVISGDENQQIYLVAPSYSGSGWTFSDQRILNSTYRTMEWFYQRNGGCGSFRLILKEEFEEADEALLEGWEIQVRIKLEDEDDFTTWYRGIIRSVERRIVGTETVTEVRGQGYLEQLAKIQVQRRYPAGQRIDQIVGDILHNYIKPLTRIVKPADVDVTYDGGIDASSYVTRGPIHFECSALRALKFLAELQGSREFGVSADRAFYFRAKATSFEDGLFQEQDLVDVIDAGQSLEKVNKLKVAGKQYGHVEALAIAQDVTDITNYGTYERTVETPWVEHQLDALRWAENIIAVRKGNYTWKSVSWNEVNKRLERNHPSTALGQLRIYGSDVSNEYDDLDIAKIKYIKGTPETRVEVNELGHPRPVPRNKSTLLRAVITAGAHLFDLGEDLEDKVVSQVEALKGRQKQFRNPNYDVTHPNSSQYTLQPAQIHGLYPPGVSDVTNSRLKETYWDAQEWNDLIGMRYRDATNFSGHFYGEELFVWEDVTRQYGSKYYWNGTSWVKFASSKTLILDFVTAPIITNDQHNYNFGSAANQEYSAIRISSSANWMITGFTGGIHGLVRELYNVGSFDIILAHQHSGSLASNRLINVTGTNLTVVPGGKAKAIYDAVSGGWRVE
jgi:hypothetical protein